MAELSGLLPVFKPSGMSSRDASRVLIRRHGKFKFGHVGTLDPDADGVLPVLIGHATKLQDYLLCMPKSYRFVLKFGTATTTLDASGEVTESLPFDHITEEAVQDGIAHFLGNIRQIPPMFSAVKMDGKELYKHARGGHSALSDDEKQRLSREVAVYEIKLLRFSLPECELKVTCSKGTYIRTIGDDLGRLLGSVAHVTFLRRELSAGFSLDQCHTLERLTEPNANISDFLIPMKDIAIGLPVWQPSDNVRIQRLLNGQKLRLSVSDFLKEMHGCPAIDDIPSNGFLIRDEHSHGVGIGEVTLETNQVLIHLKRGL